jgi:CheY-like chemotaxis protein
VLKRCFHLGLKPCKQSGRVLAVSRGDVLVIASPFCTQGVRDLLIFKIVTPSFIRGWYRMVSARWKGMPRVLIVDDSDIFRRSLRAILESHHGCEVCGEADIGEDAARLAQELRPDAIVIDISLPGINGIEATRAIRSKLPDAKIVVMSLHKSKELVKAVKTAGASGYVLKSSADSDLVDAINAVVREEFKFYVSPAVKWEMAKGA